MIDHRRALVRRAAVLPLLALLVFAGRASAADLTVMSSGGFTAAYRSLAAASERATGKRNTLVLGASMGATPTAIPNRLARGEPDDVVIMVGSALDGLIKAGEVVPGSRVDLARAPIAMAVRAGAKKPDISTVEGLKRALLSARSIAYSDSASGKYLSTELFPRLGVADAIKGKARMIPGTPVGEEVARGRAEIGFQQLSELKPVRGIDIVGPLPAGAQKITVFAAGVATRSQHPQAARKLIAFLASPAARTAVRASGLEPVH
jgi:molybdate transport system substrate-binding protein